MQTPNPFERFAEVYSLAQKSRPKDPNAAVLATVGEDGQPSARVVLLKGFDERGFVFYTNLKSRKGSELAENPYAALCFYWPELDQQVRVEGKTSAVTPAEADAYFASRPRQSQLGAWASHQSESLKSREELEQRFARLDALYAGKDIPRPPHWSGFRLAPDRVEFWQAGLHRLHHRTLYTWDGNDWSVELLNP